MNEMTDTSTAYAGANLQRANLTNAALQNRDISGANFAKATFSKANLRKQVGKHKGSVRLSPAKGNARRQ